MYNYNTTLQHKCRSGVSGICSLLQSQRCVGFALFSKARDARFDSLFPLFFNTTIFFPITYAYCGKIGLTPNSNFFQSLFLFNHICMYHGRIGSRIGLSRMLKFGLRLLVSFSCVLTRLPHKHQIREVKT